jgi:hypothetical protein
MITQLELKSFLLYDDETGRFTWLQSRNNGMLGKLAGSKNGDGYITISINNKRYQAHRLAFLYMTGEFPPDQVDHIDRNRANNAWKNLRQCSQAENSKNVLITKSNTSGYRGVTFSKKAKKWLAQGLLNGKRFHIGYYQTPELASAGYQEFAKANHGAFYRP